MAASSAEHLLSVLPGCSPAVWDPQELGALGCPDPSCQPDPSADRTTYTLTFSKYNPTPGQCAKRHRLTFSIPLACSMLSECLAPAGRGVLQEAVACCRRLPGTSVCSAEPNAALDETGYVPARSFLHSSCRGYMPHCSCCPVSPCRHRPHWIRGHSPQQLPLLQREGEVHACGAGGVANWLVWRSPVRSVLPPINARGTLG